jgi:hypothetical protein
MKCPWCVAEGERSRLTPQGSARTLMGWSPYYDEDGKYHTHDPNNASPLYLCSRGHRWVAGYNPCRSCDWGQTEDRLVDVRCKGSDTQILPVRSATVECPECGQVVAVTRVFALDESEPATYINDHFTKVSQ